MRPFCVSGIRVCSCCISAVSVRISRSIVLNDGVFGLVLVFMVVSPFGQDGRWMAEPRLLRSAERVRRGSVF
jgi:hypothetical protein